MGQQLYYDPVLSVDNSVSCATCHHPDYAFADSKSFPNGVRAQKGARNSPTVLNRAYFNTLFWDGRAPTLEEQAAGPVQNPVEMGHTLKGVKNKLMRYPAYREAFAKAFGSGHITFDMVAKAIASFERTLVSGNSPFDRYYYGHEENVLSESAKRGLLVFTRSDNGTIGATNMGWSTVEPLHETASTNVQYSTTLTPGSGCTTAPTYEVRWSVEKH